MPLEPSRTVAELHELQELTGDDAGAQRLCWTPTWLRAREWLSEKVSAMPRVEEEIDEAGNQWATLRGSSQEALLIGGHLDSVPDGGWLDGCLNVLAGLEVMRRLAEEGRPELTVRLVSWADEEGARFGRSLFGSSAASGTMDPELLRGLKDRDGMSLPEVLGACGVDLDRARDCRRQLEGSAAYLELHIEQGPILERLGLPLGVVLGTFGVERHVVRFLGQSAHAGSTPMDARRDAFAAAARLAIAVREIACRNGGVGTIGRVVTRPGIVTAIAGECELTLDQRGLESESLARMLEHAQTASRRIADDEGVRVEWQRVWHIEPLPFHPQLIEICTAAVEETVGQVHRLPSGPLHDAAEMVRADVPTAMIFVQSLNGLSHTYLEDTRPEHLEMSVRALDRAATRIIRWAASKGS
jgi:hydantoinase/carbamoylase family amidase